MPAPLCNFSPLGLRVALVIEVAVRKVECERLHVPFTLSRRALPSRAARASHACGLSAVLDP